MKQRKSILFLAITLCLCFVTMVSCGLFKPDDQKPDNQPDDQPKSYSITVDEDVQHGSIQCDVASAKAGETITVTAEAEKNFQLVSITVNGEAIDGYSFTMPENDVVPITNELLIRFLLWWKNCREICGAVARLLMFVKLKLIPLMTIPLVCSIFSSWFVLLRMN